MTFARAVADWLKVRPGEVRALLLCIAGAFCLIGFMILARTLREAFYLTSFRVETLPYITTTVNVLSVVAIGVSTRMLARYSPRRVLGTLLVSLAGVLGLLWPLLSTDVAVIAFYLATALGTLVATATFWVIVSETFDVRGAKRLFGLIAAGGTLGAMVIGTSLSWLTTLVKVSSLVPLCIALLVCLVLAIWALPAQPGRDSPADRQDEKRSLRHAASLVWKTAHLRTIALIVMLATAASALVDYQFKDFARASIDTRAGLASFFGAFYGWTGAASLGLQLAVASRVMAKAGVGMTIAVLPMVLLIGSVGVLIVPSLVFVTLARAGDFSLRKSLHRSAIEVLYVPIPAGLRRKTKGLIDSVLDNVAEGTGQAVIYLAITLGALSSRVLSVFVIVMGVAMIGVARVMNRRYRETVVRALTDEGRKSEELLDDSRFDGKDLLASTITSLQLPDAVRAAAEAASPAAKPSPPGGPGADVLDRLASPDADEVARALETTTDWDHRHVPGLTRLLARDPLRARVTSILSSLEEVAIPHLLEVLGDEQADFVIRRRVPAVFAAVGGAEVDRALLGALHAGRFEIRYWSARALVRRRRRALPAAAGDRQATVWAAIEAEVTRGRPIWEMQRLLDSDEDDDGFVAQRVGQRGALGMEHLFRMLTLVLDPEPVHHAYHGVMFKAGMLRSLALEYLEQVLPVAVRSKLWPFLGDLSATEERKAQRPIAEVVADLLKTGVTLFGTDEERAALRKRLGEDAQGAG